MSYTNTVIFYVADVAASVAFYAPLLGRQPVDQSEGFAIFILETGHGLGLWKADTVTPAAPGGRGGVELDFKLETAAEVDAWFGLWQAHNVTIALPPTDLEFGRSFVALDPDGNRLRIYSLGS